MDLKKRNSQNFKIYKLMEATIERNVYNLVESVVWVNVKNNVTINVSNCILNNLHADIYRNIQNDLKNQSISFKVKSTVLNSLTYS